MKLLDGLRHLFARPPTSAERIGEPTADRPPPPDAEAAPALEETPAAAPTLDETPTPDPASTPSFAQPATEDVVDAAPSGRVGDALVLTLATPAATFTVAKTAATIGRGQENTVRLDDLSVSRRHARIAYRQGGYWLSDLGSMGGTWVNGTRLSAPHRLAAGQLIDIGLCRLTVSAAGGASAADAKQNPSSSRSEMAGQGRRRR